MTDPVLFDRLIADAWPAPCIEEVAGWRLRFARGVTKRANSVWARQDPGDVAAAEHFYADHGLPCVFFISPAARPHGLDALLAARGYDRVDTTLIMTADLRDVRRRRGRVEISGVPSREWLDLWWSVDGRYGSGREVAKGIMTGVPAGYAMIGGSGTRARAVGRGVVQGEWISVWAMAVAPEARRQGLARAILEALLAWGREHGARRAYLTVVAQNVAARSLYERAGFTVESRYHYRVAPGLHLPQQDGGRG